MSPRSAPTELLPWVLETLSRVAGVEQARLTVVAGDAGNRRYFRTSVAGRPYIVVEAPPKTEKNPEFLAVRELLEGAGVRVPAVFAADLGRGFMLLEDLGDQVLLPQLSPESAPLHYRNALTLLNKITSVESAAATVPAYDQKLLAEEFSRFEEWFVRALLGYTPSDAELALIQRFGDQLIASALEQPRVLVHRDFHSRNLMLLADQELAVIDFQDAVFGPVTYDPVSLLKDCYIRWPVKQVRDWALEYRDGLAQSILPDKPSDEVFLRWFDWMGLQRHIKVLGTFSRLFLRDGKTGYLDDLPLVLCYVEETLAQYARDEPVFAEFSAWFTENLSPLIRRQNWSRKS